MYVSTKTVDLLYEIKSGFLQHVSLIRHKRGRSIILLGRGYTMATSESNFNDVKGETNPRDH